MIWILSLVVWLYLFFAHGRFWASQPQLPAVVPVQLPEVDIIVPARDEAQFIEAVIASLLAQDYPGNFRVIMIDDGSTDGTAERAGRAANLEVICGEPKPLGWSGKMWALNQG